MIVILSLLGASKYLGFLDDSDSLSIPFIRDYDYGEVEEREFSDFELLLLLFHVFCL